MSMPTCGVTPAGYSRPTTVTNAPFHGPEVGVSGFVLRDHDAGTDGEPKEGLERRRQPRLFARLLAQMRRSFKRAKSTNNHISGRGYMLIRRFGHHEPSPRVCMRIHPGGKSCPVVRSSGVRDVLARLDSTDT